MYIACSIYILIALRFLCAVSVRELGGDKYAIKLEKFMKRNFKNIKTLDTKVTNIEGGYEILNGKVNNLSENLNDATEELNEEINNLEEKVAVLEEALEEAVKKNEI